MYTSDYARDVWAACLLFLTAIANFIVFGLDHIRSWDDASEYSAYATNLISGRGYSMDGIAFSAWREPGYPFFLSLLYKIFGNENLIAVCYIQALFLGLLAFAIYGVFVRFNERKYGIAAGVCVAVLPFYGFYANEILTELMFTFFLGVVFAVCVKILRGRSRSVTWYAILGILCGVTSLIRFQFVLFLPFAAFLCLLFVRPLPERFVRNALIGILLSAAALAPWAAYVHTQTGKFAVSDGRQEESLYSRGVRAQLSYRELTRYIHEWILRSVSGGTGGSEFLYTYDYKNLFKQYHEHTIDKASAARIQTESIRAIITHPGQYLYSCIIEAVKLLYIDHDYSDSTNRYMRAGLYLLIYTFFAFGCVMLLMRDGPLRLPGFVALSIILYNILVLIPLIDVVPRLNTPFLMFFIIIGVVGVELFTHARGRLGV